MFIHEWKLHNLYRKKRPFRSTTLKLLIFFKNVLHSNYAIGFEIVIEFNKLFDNRFAFRFQFGVEPACLLLSTTTGYHLKWGYIKNVSDPHLIFHIDTLFLITNKVDME